jgi:hypothetical protein
LGRGPADRVTTPVKLFSSFTMITELASEMPLAGTELAGVAVISKSGAEIEDRVKVVARGERVACTVIVVLTAMPTTKTSRSALPLITVRVRASLRGLTGFGPLDNGKIASKHSLQECSFYCAKLA